MKLLEGTDSNAQDPKLTELVTWVGNVPPASRPPELFRALQKAFKLTPQELDAALGVTRKKEKSFDDLVPEDTWFSDYMRYTLKTEPPSVFHFFAGAVAIGAVLGRNVYYEKGAYQIYPNLAVLVVAPSGKCRKTSACNIAMSLLRKAGGNILADKVTPEALVEAFKDKTSTVGVIYAPEFAVFLGKQKYQEGMIPMLTALFDCPKEWRSATITRGEIVLFNVGLSMLGCSTMDWIQTAIPRDAFGGGFMSRLLFVVQEDTPRRFPRPPVFDPDTTSRLVSHLANLTQLRGQYEMTEAAGAWYDDWYMRRKDDAGDDKQFAGYNERKPDHLIRLAMVLQAGKSTSDLMLQTETLQRALAILEWLEQYLPSAFGEMHQTMVGEDHTRMLRQLKKRGGAMKHSDWLRANSNRMRQREFKEHVETLRAANLIDYEPGQHTYYLTPQGWGALGEG